MPVDLATLKRLERPLPADGYDTLTCPSCQYDVRQTLIDGFDVCPECGGAISVRTTKPRPWDDSPWAVALMFLLVGLPTIVSVASVTLVPTTLVPGLVRVLVGLAVSYPLVFVGYRYSRRRMGERPTLARSVVDAFAVVLLNVALWFVAAPFVLFVMSVLW